MMSHKQEALRSMDAAKLLAQIRRRRKKIAKELAAHEKRRQFLQENIYKENDFRMAEDMKKSFEEQSL